MRCIAFLLLASVASAACGPRGDPAQAALRARLEQEGPLSVDEIGRVLDEVKRTLEGKTISIVRGSGKTELAAGDRDVVFGM